MTVRAGFEKLYGILVGEEPISTLLALAERDAAKRLNTREVGRLRKAKRAQKHAELAAYVSSLLRKGS